MRILSDGLTRSCITVAWRFTSGQHMDGLRRSDAGWVTRGHLPTAGTRAGRWVLLSRLERAGIRLGATVGAGGSLYGLQTAPEATGATLGTLGAGAVIGAGYAAGERVTEFRHVRDWLRPLHAALSGPLGIPEGMSPRAYLDIPRDYPERQEVGRVLLPAGFTGSDGAAARVAEIVRAKLGLSDATVTPKLEGRRPYLMIRQTPRPPARFMVAEAATRDLIQSAPESAPLIGIGPRGIKVSVDLDSESPHVLVSASTGGGKSVITRTMACQMMRNGAQAVFLDYKRHSHKWARGLSNSAYCRDIEDIHDALVTLGEEGHRRNIAVDDWDGEEGDPEIGPRMVIVVEEANATIAKLRRYWMNTRTKEDPKQSPALESLYEILFMGRAVRMHVLMVAQSATAHALGGPEVRECFATRILARYTRNAWNMLVPEVQPVPRSTRHIGRAQVVLGGVAHETQVAFFSDSEARDWALSGTVADTPALGAGGCHVTPAIEPLTSADVASASRDVTPHLTLVKQRQGEPETAPTPERYSLAAAAREGIVPLSADALRQAKRRDPEFPKGDNGKWTAEELRRWHRNRPKSSAMAEGV